MQTRWTLIAVAAAVLLSGCTKGAFREETPVLELDRTGISVPAQSRDGKILDTVSVTCNRSWTVRLQDECDWLQLSDAGCENPSGTILTVPLVLSCKNNEAQQERTTALHFYTEGIELTLPVRQMAYEPPPPVGSMTNGFDDYGYEDFGNI